MLEWFKAHAQEIFNCAVLVALVGQTVWNHFTTKLLKVHGQWLKNHGEWLELQSGWIKSQSKSLSNAYALIAGRKDLIEEEPGKGEEKPCH